MVTQQFVDDALPPEEGEDGPLYRAALEAERDERLAAEMSEWDEAVGDGLTAEPEPTPRK